MRPENSQQTRPLIEVVCTCGFRRPAGYESFRAHMAGHAGRGELHYWWPEIDGVAQDRVSGSERRRRTQAGERENGAR